MAGSPLHRLQARVHKVHDLEFADVSERNSHSYVVTDVGKAYRQIDTNKWYLLTDDTGPTFVEIGGVGGGSGDVVGPGSSVDNEVVIFDGITGKIIQPSSAADAAILKNLKHYGASATDPVFPAPAAGDHYYNTVLEEEMRYDGARTKWLSLNSSDFQAGRNGNCPGGTFYRGINGMFLNATTQGYAIQKGTLVYLALTRNDSDATSLEVLVNGSVVSTFAHSASGLSENAAINIDVDAGILSFRNIAGGNTTSNLQLIARLKRRV